MMLAPDLPMHDMTSPHSSLKSNFPLHSGLSRFHDDLNMVAMIGTSDRPCWLAESCKTLHLLLHDKCPHYMDTRITRHQMSWSRQPSAQAKFSIKRLHSRKTFQGVILTIVAVQLMNFA